MKTTVPHWLVFVAAVGPGCYQGVASDSGSPWAGDGAGTQGDGDGDGGSDPSDGTDSGPQSTTNADGASGSESGGAEPNTLARGLTLARVEANQGVAVVLSEGTSVVDAGQRNADLIYGRTTLVRAFWETQADWQPRQIEARLELVDSAGEAQEYTDTLLVSGPPDERALAGAFHFVVPPDAMTPGVQFAVSLNEVDSALFDTPEPDVPPRVPAEGEAPLGIAGDEMILRVVAVPLATPSGGVVVTEANRTKIENAFMAAYPVQDVDVTFRETWNVGGALTATSQGWDILETARSQDGAAPNVYYHLLLDEDSCCANNGQFGWSGIGGVSNDTQQSAGWGGRDAMSKVDGNGEWGTGTILHELGHNHGRPHAPCGGPNGPDPDYPSQAPYTEAGIGVQGYNVVTGELYNPFPNDPPQSQFDRPLKDIMSYCWPSWWSDYNWQNNVERTRTLTSWEMQAASTGQQWILRGLIVDGAASWKLVRVPVTTDAPDTLHADGLATLVGAGAQVVHRPAFRVELSEGGAMIGIPLGTDIDFDRVDLDLGADSTSFTRAQVSGSQR